MRTLSEQGWVRDYLFGARGHYALEASVLAAGERQGFSERRLRRAAKQLGIKISHNPDCWQLTAATVARIQATMVDPPVTPAPQLADGQKTGGPSYA